MSWEDSADAIRIDFNVSLPSNTAQGVLLWNVTAKARAIES